MASIINQFINQFDAILLFNFWLAIDGDYFFRHANIQYYLQSFCRTMVEGAGGWREGKPSPPRVGMNVKLSVCMFVCMHICRSPRYALRSGTFCNIILLLVLPVLLLLMMLSRACCYCINLLHKSRLACCPIICQFCIYTGVALGVRSAGCTPERGVGS